jgi:hypothetical protein
MDIDIDFSNRETALALFKHITASRLDDGKLVKHNTGVYLHPVPVDAVTGISAIPYAEAEDAGYFKIDFLNVGIYNGIRSEDHLNSLMEQEPLWDLLKDTEFSNMLFHVNGHSGILKQMEPDSIEKLAAVLAMIRPAKRYLIGKDWATVMTEVWTKPTNNEYFFKKSHAIAYAQAVVVQMNLICENLNTEDS